MSGLASFPAERDNGVVVAAAAAAAAAAAVTSSTAPAMQPGRRNLLLVPDGSRHSSPNGSEPNSNTVVGDAGESWILPDGKPAARPRHRLDLNGVSLALKPDSGASLGGFQNSMPLPAPALSAPSSTEGRISYIPAPASMPAVQYDCADTDKPPPGCAPDAIKLFVGSIPKSCTESQLLPFFETIGKVVDLVVVRDRVTRESKGSAFLWYATRAHAEQAILQFNLRHVLHDPTGEQNRPLVLRRAKSRAKPAVVASSPASADFSDHHSAHSLAEHAAYLQQHQRPMGQAQQYQGMNLMGHPGAPQRLPPSFFQGQRGQDGGYTGDGGYHQQGSADQLLHGSGPGQMGLDSVMMALRGMHMGDQQQQQQQQESNGVSMSLALSWPQLSIIKDYMHGVQGISGAKLSITAADAPGLFCMTASGMANQVQAARDLLLTVLHRA